MVEEQESHLQRLARALVVAWAVVVLALDWAPIAEASAGA
jgi:hypothetical protein